MAEVKSEADVWRMSVPQLVDHLRTAEAKTLIEDFHAADQLDRLQTALYDVLGARSLLAAQTIAQGALHPMPTKASQP
jgi:hypothetical protein